MANSLLDGTELGINVVKKCKKYMYVYKIRLLTITIYTEEDSSLSPNCDNTTWEGACSQEFETQAKWH